MKNVKIKNIIKMIMVGLVLPVSAFSQSAIQNYILTRTYTSTSVYFDDIQYYDELGRPVETVMKQFTPTGKDLVSRVEYDVYGRESKQWLPAPNTKSDGTYNGSTTGVSYYADSYPYSENVYEPSPLNRIKDQYGPGAAWRSGSGHKVTVEYMTNSTSDPVLNCPNYSAIDGNNFQKKPDYAGGQLFVIKTTDEDGKILYEFKDKTGRLVLQRQMSGGTKYDTNYVYDDSGNLIFILPPLVSDALTTNQNYGLWNTYNNITLYLLVYSFHHDNRFRREAQLIPGNSLDAYVYDKADRLVMHQTSSIEIPGGYGGRGWIFYKYDNLGRLVLSGIYHGDDYSSNDDNIRVSNMRNLYNPVISKESISGGSAYHYTWTTFPALNQSEVTKVYYYDNYTYANDSVGSGCNLAYQTKSGYGTQHTSNQGLLTVSWEKLLDGSGWIRTAYYYDASGNLIQKRSNNQKGGYDYEYYAYNHNNLMTKKYTEHLVSGQSQITEEYAYEYDARLRLKTVNYKFNGGTGVNIAEYQYNDLGQAMEKKTGGAKETTAITYNLRGWLTSQAGVRFSENLYYTSNPKSGGQVYYGGNISALTWKSEPLPTTVRGFSFQYDALGMLTNAAYGEGAALNTATFKYDESFTYDKHGNIKTLKRYGLKDNNTFGLIDDLSMTDYMGNALRKVLDAAGNQSSSDVMEFKKGFTGLGEEYIYGSNGALMSDYNRNICMIKYNYLILPQSVQFRRGDRIEYVYDAAGVKRQTTHKQTIQDKNYPYWSLSEPAPSDFDASKTIVTDYVGNKIYVNNQLKYVFNEEGYMEKIGSSFNAFYYLNDHLGSRRVILNSAGTVSLINNYYPSGVLIAELPREPSLGAHPYKFTGKELDHFNSMDFYDFEARAFDPTLMRFNRPDPMAEKYPSLGTFTYCANNPVNYVDPTGLDWYMANDSSVVWFNSTNKHYAHEGVRYKNIGKEYQGMTVEIYEGVDNYMSSFGSKPYGMEIKLGYNGEDGDYQWVQTIDTDSPRDPRIKSPYVDPTPADDDMPYYHKTGNNSFLNKDGYDVTFYDAPARYGSANWSAELSLVKKTGRAKQGETTSFHYDPIMTLSYGFQTDGKNNRSTYMLRVVKNPSAFHLRSINQKVQYPTLVPSTRRR